MNADGLKLQVVYQLYTSYIHNRTQPTTKDIILGKIYKNQAKLDKNEKLRHLF